MAFTPEEQQIINWSRQNGKTVQEMKDAIFRYRTTGSPAAPQSEKQGSTVGQDVAIGVAKGAGETAKFLGGTAARAAAQASGFNVIPGVRESVDTSVGKVQDAIGLSDKNLEATNTAQKVGKGIEVAAELASPLIVGKLAGVAEQGAKVLESKLPKPGKVTQFVKDARLALSDIDPQVETVLQRSTFDEVNKYFQQAKNAKADPTKYTPLELAGQKAEDAFDEINKARKAAVQGKKKILDTVATQRVSGNTINDVMSTGIQRISEKFGAKISAKGEVSQAKGRTLQLDDKDTKLIGDYFSRLNSLGISPSVKQVDDFVDWAQSQLYKQSKTVSKYEVASEPVVRELQSVTGDLNSRLKGAVGNGYGEVNARISKLIELQDELSSALGADARKGGGLMKRLFSPTGGNVRKVFEEIQKETGIDLSKEATLAKFAMEGVGDVRQQSLLKQLDVLSKDAGELDLTKPMSIIRFIRERADLDAQELANEIVRRASSSQ